MIDDVAINFVSMPFRTVCYFSLRIALAALGLASCTPQRQQDVLVLASGADLESANPLVTTHPLSRQIQRYALFVTLLRYDSTLSPQPYFARSYHWSDAGRTLTLSLVRDLRWHDGVSTTSRDAAFTFLAARDPATGFPRAAELATLDTAIAVDDTTLQLHFTRAPARLPPLLAELPIVPEHLLAKVPHSAMRSAGFNSAPIGNGPFRFVARRRGASWSFTRNDLFPASLGGPPALHGLVIAVVDEATTKFAGLASGELDMAGIAPTMAALAKRDATLRVLTYPIPFGVGLFFNTTRAPFDDARVRLAIARSIDRSRIVEIALAGFGTPASTPVPPESPLAWREAPPQIDTMRADSLLDAAGWRRAADGVRVRAGRRLHAELLTVGTGDNVAEQLIQADLAARGIELSIRQTEMGTFLTTARATDKRFDLLLAGIPGDISLSYIDALFGSRQRGGALDYTAYHSAALDALIDAARNAAPGDAERSAWRNVQAALDTLAPATWIYHSRGVQGISRRVHGATMDLRGELVTVHDWTLAPIGSR
ncbi:MAG TPA: peptide ABC transporter substrate-binding protein [Gemmatimonadaceae bacterium]|nr:peptide ABC transporter substrate-binding protein [Gemmatimonadaceae bacterium]